MCVNRRVRRRTSVDLILVVSGCIVMEYACVCFWKYGGVVKIVIILWGGIKLCNYFVPLQENQKMHL